jgi:hypothetical protein
MAKGKNTQQSFCCAFFLDTHGKGRTADFCMAKGLCRALLISHAAKSLCHASNTAHGKEKHLTAPPFVVHLVWRRTTKSEVFVVRLIPARTANEKRAKNYKWARRRRATAAPEPTAASHHHRICNHH